MLLIALAGRSEPAEAPEIQAVAVDPTPDENVADQELLCSFVGLRGEVVTR